MRADQSFTELRRFAGNIHLMGSQVYAGSVNVTTSPQSLGSASLLRGVWLQVDSAAIDRVWVVADMNGQPGEGISLDAGDRYFFLPVSDLNQVWWVATAPIKVGYWAI